MPTPVRGASSFVLPELGSAEAPARPAAAVDTVVTATASSALLAGKPSPSAFAAQAWVKELSYFNSPAFYTSSPDKNQWFTIDERTKTLLASRPELLRQIQLMMDYANSVMASDLYENEKKDFLERFFSDTSFAGGVDSPFGLGEKDLDDDQNASVAGRIIAAAMSYDHKFLVTLAWGTGGQNGHGADYGSVGIMTPDGSTHDVDSASDGVLRSIYMKFANAANKWKTDNGITRPENDPKYESLYKKYLGSDEAAANPPPEDPAVLDFFKRLRSGQRL